MSPDLGRVVPMPVRQGGRAAASTVSGATTIGRRLADDSVGMVDDWGRDPALVRFLTVASTVRWSTAVGGEQRLPKRGGALIVVNTRRFALAPVLTAFALERAVQRPIRFVGRPDDAPIGALARRVGALLDDPDEVGGALRAGELVVLGAAPSPSPRRVGIIDHFHIGAAVAASVPIFPVATTSTPLTRRAWVEVGAHVRSRQRRRGPLAELELADQIAEQIELLLAELGDLNTGWPFEQFIFGRQGGIRMTYVRVADGTRIHYSIVGRSGAPPILFIQGLGADKNGWNLQRLACVPRYRAVALDNRGAGRSDKPHGRYTLGQMAEDAIAVLDHAGIETAHVVGASMGGAISQMLAVEHPDRIRSLTLACTAGRNHPWREELLASWRDAALERGIGSMGQEAARWVIGPRSFRRLLPAIGWLGPLALGRPSHAFAAQVDAILDVDMAMAERVREIEAPTLVLVGNQDILTPRGDSEELADRIPTAELVVISGAAHGFMVEHATTFNRVLFDFIKRAERVYQERSGTIAEPLDAAVG